jgi:ferritin-like metal-binding protein YciE
MPGSSRRPSVSNTMRWLGTVQTFAKLLGEKEAAELFTLTLNEEKATDKKLSLLAIEF